MDAGLRSFWQGRAAYVVDLGLVLWIVVWIVVAAAVSRDVQNLTQLSDNAVTIGDSLASSGHTLQGLRPVPLVGGRIADVGDRIVRTGRKVRSSGYGARKNIHSTSVLLAAAVGVIPSAPLVFLYVPFRIASVRSRRGRRGAHERPAGSER
jgi:hypothetical protein